MLDGAAAGRRGHSQRWPKARSGAWQRRAAPPQARSGLWRQASTGGAAAIGGAFRLTDHAGRTVTADDFAGRHMLVYFGYTFCPDVCPTELQSMSVALDSLGDDASRVRPVFITIDPARDTVPVLAEYRRHFHPDLVALTGGEEQITAAAKAYRVYFAKGEDDGDGGYLMDHSSIVFLMGPDGEYIRHFSANTPPEAMAEGIRAVL